jgi:hypothetical protein
MSTRSWQSVSQDGWNQLEIVGKSNDALQLSSQILSSNLLGFSASVAGSEVGSEAFQLKTSRAGALDFLDETGAFEPFSQSNNRWLRLEVGRSDEKQDRRWAN